ncbi:MarR family transcriptional regulator [Nocardia terpenica]|uniref:Transcriptional regulator n=3 Tax=Nocardia terpenica TaxID=455432 RepID=A0A164HX26_9NOCA|nr:MarR family transcriptional regulator [Nocardia terpenica]ATL65456.1 transcriptional regulator [Nocardia terpenica]KZM68893.1 transcriptional regulator [Nocardia terpenica]MBF6062289.1 MarR family transcriptional regulator [Nocardia terpenica]MBF6104377.1 MarR family transcriptional regulator [Nocardia terpenica]MBF6109767.1 MarR family transcriptional regulator [Nocardia terpenica]
MSTIVSGFSTLHGALRAAERSWLRHLDDALCARQLSADQWAMLSNLSDRNGVTMSELAARSQLPPSSATRHADALAERGLIFRIAAEDDRRRILIGLTKRGVELMESVRAEELRAETELRKRMGARNYTELLRLLEAVAEVPAD